MMEIPFPQKLARLDLERLRAYQENLDFYNGHQWPSRTRPRRERQLTFNYARVFTEKVTSYLMSGVSLVVEPWDSSPPARERALRAEVSLRQVAEENSLEGLDFDTEMDCAILGDGGYKVTWDGGQVRITAPDVQGLYAWWAGDHMGQVWRVACRYRLSAEEIELLYGHKLPLGRREGVVVEVWTAKDFELWLDNALLEHKANPYGFIPFVIYPNLREPKKFWGVSDIPALKEAARELNRALSQLSMILELSGNPIAVLENVEDARDIAVQPGAVWELPDRAKAYLLDLLQGGGIRLHIDYIDLLYRTLHDLSEAPRTAFGDNRQGLSGVALEMELHPLLQKVRRKRLVRAQAYRKRAEMVLRLLELRTGQSFLPCRIRVVWGPMLPQDRSRQVSDEQVLVASGLHSRRRAMDNLGVEDAEGEFQRWLEEERLLKGGGDGRGPDERAGG
ncbi:MAG TPA: phage portal protein [Dehalococcoidia bacterium]|nr:phage portal protein [Dehalococcoidia bacterium]